MGIFLEHTPNLKGTRLPISEISTGRLHPSIVRRIFFSLAAG